MSRPRPAPDTPLLTWDSAANQLGHSALNRGRYACGCGWQSRSRSVIAHRDRAVALHLKSQLRPAGVRLATGLLTVGFAGTLDDLLAVGAIVDG